MKGDEGILKMSDLEKGVIHTRNHMNDVVDKLAEDAMNDSETYIQAINKLKQFRWNLNGPLSTAIIETAIERIEQRALHANIERNH